jgi:protein SCO1/2
MNTMKAIRIAVWAAVAVLGAAVVWFVVADRTGDQTGIAAATIGGPFSLSDQTGATVTEAALQGHPSALFFGYTYCPDVCPTTLFEMTTWLEQLGPDSDKLKVYFVTVDPERDTREQMAAYLQAFDPRILGLTGSREAVDQMLKAYRVYSRKVEGDDPDSYTMDHSASVYLLDSDATFVSTVDYQENPDRALEKLRRLIANS